MDLSESALMLLIESVWAVSARRAFDDGYELGVCRRTPEYHQPWKADVLAKSEDIHRAAMVLVRDEVTLRLRAVSDTIQALHDRASKDTSYGKSQRAILRLVLGELQAADAVDPHVGSTGNPSTRV